MGNRYVDPEPGYRALAENRKVQPTIIHPQNDLAYYDALMARDDIPASTSPSVEVQWIAFKLPRSNKTPEALQAIWNDAPSKSAATWLRQLRLKSELQKKFWTDTWPYYMESRLALEVKAAAPPAASSRRKTGITLPTAASKSRNDSTIAALRESAPKKEDNGI